MLPSFRLIAATFLCGFLVVFAGLRLAASLNDIHEGLPVMAAHAAPVSIAPVADQEARRGLAAVPVMYDLRFAVSRVASTPVSLSNPVARSHGPACNYLSPSCRRKSPRMPRRRSRLRPPSRSHRSSPSPRSNRPRRSVCHRWQPSRRSKPRPKCQRSKHPKSKHPRQKHQRWPPSCRNRLPPRSRLPSPPNIPCPQRRHPLSKHELPIRCPPSKRRQSIRHRRPR